MAPLEGNYLPCGGTPPSPTTTNPPHHDDNSVHKTTTITSTESQTYSAGRLSTISSDVLAPSSGAESKYCSTMSGVRNREIPHDVRNANTITDHLFHQEETRLVDSSSTSSWYHIYLSQMFSISSSSASNSSLSMKSSPWRPHCRNSQSSCATPQQTAENIFSTSSLPNKSAPAAPSTTPSYRHSDALKWASLLLVVVQLLLLTVTGSAAFETMSLMTELRPRVFVSQDDVAVQSFHGNQSHTDHFRLLQRDGDYILIGARNIVFNISTLDLSEDYSTRIVWQSTKTDSQMCFSKGKSESDCQNYIRVLAKKREGEFLVCGTNAYKPLCRDYSLGSNGNVSYEEGNGIGKCPYDPRHNSTFVFAGGELYSGTVADFQGTIPLIFREPIKTDHNDFKQLNAPDFVHSFRHGDHVFFFLRETAVEYMNCGKRIYSRVARVCLSDKGGGLAMYPNLWTSFLKSRLNCSVPGEFPFYFDEIQSTSDVVAGVYAGTSHSLVYAIFNTPPNSIPGSAVCVFSMQDIQDAFDGRFKHQENMNSNWLPVKNKEVPDPRPGECVEDSRGLPEESVNFIKTHPLMDQAVPTFYNKPLLVKASFDFRLTKLAVDPQVPLLGASGGAVDVLFLATDSGVILKMINALSSHTTDQIESVIIEEIHLFDVPTPVANLQLAQQTTGDTKLIVITDDAVTAIPLHRCHLVSNCSGCVGLQDPYCAWFEGAGVCGAAHGKLSGPVFQNVTSGVHYQCPKSGENNLRPLEVPSPVTGPVIGASAAEGRPIYSAETLAIAVTTACVAALVIGFISGFLFSRKCRGGEDYASHTYTDTPYLESKLNKCDNLGPSADPNMYSSNNKHFNNLVTNFNPKNTNGKSNTNTTTTTTSDIKPAKCAYI